jgi:hypothetical protein
VEGVPITIETETAAAAVEAWRARVRRTHVIAIVLTVFPLGLSASRDVSEMLAGVWEVMLCFAIGVAASARPWWLDHAHVNARARARERGRVPS